MYIFCDIILVYNLKGEFAFEAKSVMKTLRNFVLFFTITATAIISGFINVLGGIALCFFVDVKSQENIDLFTTMGSSLLFSSVFLIFAVVIATFKKIWVPLIFNILGSGLYIYTVSELYAIPNNSLPKTVTEPLAERHLMTVIVTLLLLFLIVLNYFDEKNVNKRKAIMQKKNTENERQLTSEEKIL